MSTSATRTASYKGRTYRLLWSGKTKHGARAHLQFMDGSKDFWVDAGAVTEAASSSPSRIYDNRIERDSGGMYCGYPCPVSGRRCCAANGPCHDCM